MNNLSILQRSTFCKILMVAYWLLLVTFLPSQMSHANESEMHKVDFQWAKIGQLNHQAFTEISGAEQAVGFQDRVWLHNDTGKPVIIYQIDRAGNRLVSLEVRDLALYDFEDMSQIIYQGKTFLILADIGDNKSRRSYMRLVLVDISHVNSSFLDACQNATQTCYLEAYHQIKVVFEDGPRDAEALAFDAADQAIYIITKRDGPPRLYGISLADVIKHINLQASAEQTDEDQILTLSLLTRIHAIIKPKKMTDIRSMFSFMFHWPTAMDISSDGSMMAILSYGYVFLFHRQHQLSWAESLQSEPNVYPLYELPQAEAMTFIEDDASATNKLWVFSEGTNTAIFELKAE